MRKVRGRTEAAADAGSERWSTYAKASVDDFRSNENQELGAWGRAEFVSDATFDRSNIAACRHAPIAIVMRQAVTRRFSLP